MKSSCADRNRRWKFLVMSPDVKAILVHTKNYGPWIMMQICPLLNLVISDYGRHQESHF